MPVCPDHVETQPTLVPPNEWENTAENHQMLQREDDKLAAQKEQELGKDSNALESLEPKPVPKDGDSAGPTQCAFPEVPTHQPITRRNQFQCKKTIKEEKDAKKTEKKTSKKADKEESKKDSKKKKNRKAKGKTSKAKGVKKHKKCKAGKRKSKAKRVTNAQKKRRVVHEEDRGDSAELDQPVPEDPKAPKGEVKQPPATPKMAQQKNSGKPKGKKGKGKNSKEKAPKRQRKPKEPAIEAVVDQAFKVKTKKILCKCYHPEHKCLSDHSDIEVPLWSDKLQLSVYWTRKAVGVKAVRDALPARFQKKGKAKGKWQQIAYISGGPCTYVNVELAHTWVFSSAPHLRARSSCMHD